MPSLIKPGVLAAANTNFNTRFNQGTGVYRPWWNRLAMEMPSQTAEEVYAWLQKLPGLRPWPKGSPRKRNRTGANAYRLRNEKFEDTVAVAVDDFEDDRIGIYAPMFEMMGHAVARFPDLKVAETIMLGTSALCFDGKPFFATDHPVDMNDAGKGTYANLRASKPLDEANLNSGIAAFANFKDESGERIGVRPTRLVVPPSLRSTAAKLVEADTIIQIVGSVAAAVSNTNKGIVTVEVIDELEAEPDVWYLAADYGPMKPIIYQHRLSSGLVRKTSETDDNVFDDDEYVWGVKERAAFGYSFPFLMLRSNPS